LNIDLHIVPRYYTRGHFTPGVHKAPGWYGECRISLRPYQHGIEGASSVIESGNEYVAYVTDKSYDSAEKALIAIRKLVPPESLKNLTIIPELDLDRLNDGEKTFAKKQHPKKKMRKKS